MIKESMLVSLVIAIPGNSFPWEPVLELKKFATGKG
jgi:hypothetical protein